MACRVNLGASVYLRRVRTLKLDFWQSAAYGVTSRPRPALTFNDVKRRRQIDQCSVGLKKGAPAFRSIAVHRGLDSHDGIGREMN